MPDGDTMETGENTDMKPGPGLPNGAPPPLVEDPPEEEAQSERELTQTDHLNKSLLTSFLDRLNDPSSAFASMMMAGQDSAGQDSAMQEPQPPSHDPLQDQVDGNGDASHYHRDEEMGEGNTATSGEDARSPSLPDDWSDKNTDIIEK